MALSADTLLDRMHLKTQLRRWRVIAFILGVIAVLVAIREVAPLSAGTGMDRIARFKVENIITDDADRHELLADVRDNNTIKALIVEIDSPGGTSVGGEQLYLDLREIAAKKPVVALMRTMATSAGYMTALGADYIFAREGTLTGSIGVLVQSVEISELAAKLGVKPFTVKSGDLKGTPSPLEPVREQDTAMLQDVVQQFYGWFLNLTQERRKLTPDQLQTISSGRVFSGRQALNLNLVDAIGGEKEALAWLAKEKKVDADLPVKEVKVPDKDSFWGQMMDSVSPRNLLKNITHDLDGLVSIWQPAASPSN